MLKLDKNPYIDRKYFAQRKFQLEANKLSGRAKRVFQAQKGLCPLCNGEMGELRERKLYHRIITEPSKAEEKSELLFMHIACVRQSRKVNTGMDTIMPCYS